MLKELKPFLKDPKIRAYADFWAMVPKAALSSLPALIGAILAMRVSAFFILFIIIYPFVALIVDGVLYLFRNRIWEPLAEDAIIPTAWNITGAELEQYAKMLPKVRLMRALTSPLLMLLVIQAWDVLMTIVGFGVCFFISVFFDAYWLNFFKVKKPKRFETRTIVIDPDWEDFKQRSNNADPSRLGSAAWNMEQMDATVPGTPATIAMHHHEANTFVSGSAAWMSEPVNPMVSDTSLYLFQQYLEP